MSFLKVSFLNHNHLQNVGSATAINLSLSGYWKASSPMASPIALPTIPPKYLSASNDSVILSLPDNGYGLRSQESELRIQKEDLCASGMLECRNDGCLSQRQLNTGPTAVFFTIIPMFHYSKTPSFPTGLLPLAPDHFILLRYWASVNIINRLWVVRLSASSSWSVTNSTLSLPR